MANNQNGKLVKRFFDEVCNQRMLDTADELFSANHTYHDPQVPADRGPEGMKKAIAGYHKAFPDAFWKVKETLLSDNYITTRWTGSGTHKGELNGIPPTGKFVAVDGIWIHKLENEKIVESWNVWDTLGLMQQFGIVPAMVQPAEAMK